MTCPSRSCRSEIFPSSTVIVAPLAVPRLKGKRRLLPSVALRADRLASIPARKRLIDPHLRARARDEPAQIIPGPSVREECPIRTGIERPRVDRVLEEPDRAVQE